MYNFRVIGKKVKSGKTTEAMNMMKNQLDKGHRVLYVSSEIASNLTVENMKAGRSKGAFYLTVFDDLDLHILNRILREYNIDVVIIDQVRRDFDWNVLDFIAKENNIDMTVFYQLANF